MLITLYGPDSYRRQGKLKEYVNRYQAKFKGLSLRYFDLENPESFLAFKDFVKAQSLFEESQLGILNGLNELSDAEKKEVKIILKDQLETKSITVIINEPKLAVKDWGMFLKKPAIVDEFSELKEGELQSFIKTEGERRGITVDVGSQYVLMQLYGGDTWGIVTELDKIALMGKSVITKIFLEKHLDEAAPINIFNALNQFRDGRDMGARLATLEKLLINSEDPGKLFNILAISPYSDSTWKQKMADYDTAIKSGKLEYEEVLADIALT
ncbi:MAG TPA: hypothetical protein VJH70_03135 [Candidatus Paceibacterota bacterium]